MGGHTEYGGGGMKVSEGAHNEGERGHGHTHLQ